MRRLIELLSKLYPKWWRERYGPEFDALIEDERATARVALNVLSGAFWMRMRTLLGGSPRDSRILGTLTKNWWLLALSGGIQAIISALYLIMQSEPTPLSFHAWNSMLVVLGRLGLTAGACVIMAALLASRNGKCWLLVLNGSALVVLGVIELGLTGFGVRFWTVAMLVILMAASTGVLELRMAQMLRKKGRYPGTWILSLTSAISVGFVLPFLALALRWIKIEPGSHTDLLWLGVYFAFSAVSMFTSALRLHTAPALS